MTRKLVCKVCTLIRYPFVNASNDLLTLDALGCPLRDFLKSALRFGESVCILAKETGILDFLTIGKRSKGSCANVNANALRFVGQNCS